MSAYAQRWLNLGERNSTPASSSTRLPGTSFFSNRCQFAEACQSSGCAALASTAPSTIVAEILTLLLIQPSSVARRDRHSRLADFEMETDGCSEAHLSGVLDEKRQTGGR